MGAPVLINGTRYKAVGGTVERNGSILCRCPVHEASGIHNPSLVLSITEAQRIIFHCRSQNCDAKHFQAIRDHLVEKCGLPRSHVGGNSRAQGEFHYHYVNLDGSYSWTKIKRVTRTGKKTFVSAVYDKGTDQWTFSRPKGCLCSSTWLRSGRSSPRTRQRLCCFSRAKRMCRQPGILAYSQPPAPTVPAAGASRTLAS